MTDLPAVIKIGTRGSTLALKQTHEVSDLLHHQWPSYEIAVQVMSTYGDEVRDVPLPEIGGKGVFTSNLEASLYTGGIDLAVHSYKDLPIQAKPGVVIGATPRRASAADVLISRAGYTLDTLPKGATVGTSSRRRTAQLLHLRPDLKMMSIRGNVDTRIQKALDPDGPYDAIVLACAGLARLDKLAVASQILPFEIMLPAPAQGAMGVQARDTDYWRGILQPISDPATELSVTAERAFLSALGGGCALPVAAYATVENEQLHLAGRVTAPDGSVQIDVAGVTPLTAYNPLVAQQAGFELGEQAKERGADQLLEELR